MPLRLAGDADLSDVIVAPETRDLDDLARDLTHWLARQMPAASDIVLDNLTYPRGAGQSHETILFDARWNEGGVAITPGLRACASSRVLSRCFPTTCSTNSTRSCECCSEGGYVPVAKPLWFESDPAVLGKPFFVMEKKRRPRAGQYPALCATSGWLSEATPGAAAAHVGGRSAPARRRSSACRSTRCASCEGPPHAREGLAQEWDKYVRFVDWLSATIRARARSQAGLDRLEANWPENQPAGLVWGDARIGNMMFDDDFDVVAVMDWEQPSLGGALHDLAWFTRLPRPCTGAAPATAPTWRGWEPARKRSRSGRRSAANRPTDLEWYEDFIQLKMSCSGMRLDNLRGTNMLKEEYIAARLKVG